MRKKLRKLSSGTSISIRRVITRESLSRRPVGSRVGICGSVACGAFAYATVRFIEAYGLWHMRAWAEWFAIISGSIYLPVEVYELIRHPTLVKAVVMAVNVMVVGYLVWIRMIDRRPAGDRNPRCVTILLGGASFGRKMPDGLPARALFYHEI